MLLREGAGPAGAFAVKRVTTVEFIRNFGTYSDRALSAPIVLTKNGRDRLVFIGIEQYDKLKNAYESVDDVQPNASLGRRSHRGRVRRGMKDGGVSGGGGRQF